MWSENTFPNVKLSKSTALILLDFAFIISMSLIIALMSCYFSLQIYKIHCQNNVIFT